MEVTLSGLSLHQLLFRAYHGQNNILQPQREELGLGRGQPRILGYLLEHGPSSQSDIASYFDTDPASISRMTEALRLNGFLTRQEDSQCRRANRLELTDKGRLAAGRWKDECAQVNDMMLDGFDQNEKKMLEALLSRLIENLRRHRG